MQKSWVCLSMVHTQHVCCHSKLYLVFCEHHFSLTTGSDLVWQSRSVLFHHVKAVYWLMPQVSDFTTGFYSNPQLLSYDGDLDSYSYQLNLSSRLWLKRKRTGISWTRTWRDCRRGPKSLTAHWRVQRMNWKLFRWKNIKYKTNWNWGEKKSTKIHFGMRRLMACLLPICWG